MKHPRDRDRLLRWQTRDPEDALNYEASSSERTPRTTMFDQFVVNLFSSNASKQEIARNSRLRFHRNPNVRDYVMCPPFDDNSPEWLRKPEIPSSLEIKGEDESATIEEEIEIEVNRVHAPWESRAQYLEAHYRLLREDAVTPLRNAVSEVREDQHILEKDSFENAAIYEKVFIVGFTFANAGIAARISFSTRRIGKRVLWEQSKRLLSGSIVALTPAKDAFRKTCLVAVVAARPVAGLEQNPPEIDIFFAKPEEIEIDPHQEWLMVESRTGFFEACRHPLLSLQKMAKESFPLAKHLVDLDHNIRPPSYLEEQPMRDLSDVFTSQTNDFGSVDTLENWPMDAKSTLDSSQTEALQRILTKQLAIAQGPPGTGKTHVSVIALRTLHKNLKTGDPPIIVASHTNHALDQLLRHIMTFEKEFIRLGGFTTDLENIKPRTLHEVKQLVAKRPEITGGPRTPALIKIRRLVNDMTAILRPLTEGTLISSEVFVQHGILTEGQRESLIEGMKDWLQADESDKESSDMDMWLGKERRDANMAQALHFFDFPTEEVDLEFEQLKELEAETKLDEDEEIATLKGSRIRLDEPYTGNSGPYSPLSTDEKIKAQLDEQDLWKIKHTYRGAVYTYMQRQVKIAIRDAFRQKAAEHTTLVKELKIGRWEIEANVLEQAKIIGCTTTGLSKYRGLLASIKPKIIMIEEAAETLEAYVTAACLPSLEHLILVGDHEQLRGHCSCKELEGFPFFLDVSMFERLVRHGIGHTQLIKQRRMIPEIRRLLMPIYENLEDHPSVHERKAVPGMGGMNSYFFMHDWIEDTDNLMSKVNIYEADMIVAFFNYLVYNGMKSEEITVLTFYNGQRKLILSKLRRHQHLQGNRFEVVTVDSYQGEENSIVLLSLVRSNHFNSVGFLSVINRVCVALSRAQRGLYIFGNGPLLFHNSFKWFQVGKIMGEKPRRIGWTLPIVCQVHRNHEYIKLPEDFDATNGGCKVKCNEELRCGHICGLPCHPFPHREVICHEACEKPHECGHPCLEACHAPCRCVCRNDSVATENIPTKKTQAKPHPRLQSVSGVGTDPFQLSVLSNAPLRELSKREIKQSVRAFREYSNGGHVEADKEVVAKAKEQAAIATDEETMEKLRIADEEAAAALFGEDFSVVPPKVDANKTSPTKVSPKKNGNGEFVDSSPGKRQRWQEFFVVGGNGEQKHRQPEVSLLD